MHDWLIIVLLDRSLRLIQTRLVNHRSPIYQTSEQFSLCIRHGGEEGVTCHVIAFDTKSDQGNTSEQYSTVLIFTQIFCSWLGDWNCWQHSQCCQESQEVDQSGLYHLHQILCTQMLMFDQVSYKGHNCELTVDYEEGFTLKDGQTNNIVFNKNFQELINSSDDGARLLWLEFRHTGEEEIDLGKNPKPLVFVIHTFLSAKV